MPFNYIILFWIEDETTTEYATTEDSSSDVTTEDSSSDVTTEDSSLATSTESSISGTNFQHQYLYEKYQIMNSFQLKISNVLIK